MSKTAFILALPLAVIGLSTAMMLPSSVEVRHPVYPVPSSPERIATLRAVVAPLMALSEAELTALVPDRTGFRFMGCPNCQEGTQEGQLVWSITDPHHVRCRFCQVRLPNERFPEDRVLRVRNPVGVEVEYPYWEDGTGYRHFFTAKAWRETRVYLAARTQDLGELYQMTGEAPYARRAGLILATFARHYPGFLVSRDWPHQPKGFALEPPYPNGGGKWGRWRYEEIPTNLVYAYDSIFASGELERLARETGTDVRRSIEQDFFRGAIRQDGFHGPLYENASPDTYQGYAVVGRVLGDAGLVHEAVRRCRGLFERRFFVDGFWFEGAAGYHRVTLEDMERVFAALRGHSDPPGYRDAVDGTRFERLDLEREIPLLARAKSILPRFRYPDGRPLPVHDSGGIFVSARPPELLERSVSTLFPGAGHAWLGRGAGEEQVQLHLHFSGAYGHHHADNLSLALFAKGEELLPDLGYSHTRYRSWTSSTPAHNTVVIDEGEQYTRGDHGPADGRLLAFETADPTVQWLEAAAECAYPGLATRYQRGVLLVEAASGESYAVDLFRVEGGSRHDWMMHGSADRDTTARASFPLTPFGANLLAGVKVRFPQNEGDPGEAGGRNLHYAFIQNVTQGPATDGATVRIAPTKGPGPGVRMHLAGMAGAKLLLGDAPSVRRAAENDALLDRYRMPVLLARSEGTAPRSSVFVAVHEPYGAQPFIERVALEQPASHAQDAVVLAIRHHGVTDHIVHRLPPVRGSLTAGALRLRGEVGFIRERDGIPERMTLWGGTELRWKGDVLRASDSYTGSVKSVLRTEAGDPHNALVVSGTPPADASLESATVLVSFGDGSTLGCRLQRVRRERARTLLLLEEDPGFGIEDGAARHLFFPLRRIPGPVTYRIRTSASVALRPGQPPRITAVGPVRFGRE